MKVSQKIVDYAIRYYLRYYPSTEKLRRKLKEKFGPDSEKWQKYGGVTPEQIEYILKEKLRNIIEEEAVVRAKIKLYQLRNKNLRYIQNSMKQKLFEWEMVEKILQEEVLEEWKSILNPQKLQKQIELYFKKGKSKLYVRQRFIERSEDRELVESIIQEVYGENEIQALQKEYEKIKHKWDNQKTKEKLLRKWFHYGDIQQIFDEYWHEK